MSYFFIFLTAGLNTAANLLLKAGADRTGAWTGVPLGELLRERWMVGLGLVLYALSAVSYILLLRLLPLSVAYPIIMAATLIAVNVTSQLYLNETISAPQTLGYIFLIAGITLIFAFRG